MPTYLLECACGESVRVEPRQAGEAVICQCGARLAVPRLSELRALPQASDDAPKGSSGWGARQGVLTAGALACLLFGGIGAYFWQTEPAPLGEFTVERHGAQVEQGIERWRPLDAWAYWLQLRPALAKGRLDPMERPAEEAIQRQITMHRIYRWSFLGVAAVAVIGSVAVAMSMGSRDRS